MKKYSASVMAATLVFANLQSNQAPIVLSKKELFVAAFKNYGDKLVVSPTKTLFNFSRQKLTNNKKAVFILTGIGLTSLYLNCEKEADGWRPTALFGKNKSFNPFASRAVEQSWNNGKAFLLNAYNAFRILVGKSLVQSKNIEKDKLQNQIDTLNQKNSTLINEKNDLNNKTNDLNKEILKWQNDYTNKTKELSTRLENFKENSTIEKTRLKNQLKELNDEQNKLKEVIENNKSDLNKLQENEQQIESLNNLLVLANEKVERLEDLIKIKEVEIKGLQQIYYELEQKYNEATKKSDENVNN